MMIDYTKKITKGMIKKVYNLSEREFENLRRRTAERLKSARSLYEWDEEDLPSVNRLIDYRLRKTRYPLGRYEVIFATPTTKKPGKAARLQAVRTFAGESGYYNRGFATFSEGILNFQRMKSNAEKIISGHNDIEELEPWEVGEPFSVTKNYVIGNNAQGKTVVRQINTVFNAYNTLIKAATKENALSLYIKTVRAVMHLIQYVEENDLLIGTND